MRFRWLNVLLVAIPLAVVVFFLNRQAAYAGQFTTWIFAFALVALIPLAALIGRLTGTLSRYYGDRVGGLLGASFGNIPELAIGVFLLVHARVHASNPVALKSDLDVIHGLLIGSVINNILFVLGSSIFIAALRNGRMNFSAEGAAGYASMLALAVVGLALPTLATKLTENPPAATEDAVSVAFGVILIISYIAYVASSVFDLGARPHPRNGKAAAEGASAKVDEVEGMPLLADDPAHETELEKIVTAEEMDAETTKRKLRELRRGHGIDIAITIVSFTVVTLLTVGIAAMLVSVTDSVIQSTPLTPLSVGLILFPVVCNLGEQAGAIVTAWQNHMEGAMSVAAGSSVQVALFVTPVLVLLSFLIGGFSHSLVLSLLFAPLQLITLGLVAFVYALVSLDGETTWLEGLQLLAFYAMIVAVAFALPGA